jgi:hypothetical protein
VAGTGSRIDDAVRAYLDGLDPDGRALFDRLDGLVVAAWPEVAVVLSYRMPTYVVGERQLHVGVWKHGLSLYGWSPERSGGFCDRYPALCGARGTLKIPHADAARIPDEHLRDLVRAALAP